jgi:hypothetical protein
MFHLTNAVLTSIELIRKSVLCRHEKLAPLHAGLLLKLAAYVQEDEEGHLRCRWGEGEYCYGGDLTSSMSGESAVPRLVGIST